MTISTILEAAPSRAFICLAVLASVTFPASMAEALYGPRVTIGAYYQQTSSTTSIDGTSANGCGTGNPFGSCRFVFQPAPKPIVVELVSCFIQSTENIPVRYVALQSRIGADLPFRYSVLPAPVAINVIHTVASGAVQHPLAVGERALVQVDFGESSAVAGYCTISGRVIPTP